MSDIVPHQAAHGVAVKNPDGSLGTIIVEIGIGQAALSVPNKHDIQGVDLQRVVYQDALQVLKQDWPQEHFGYYDAKVTYGDVTGDGRDEAVFSVRYRLSGEASTSSLSHVFVYTPRYGQGVVMLASFKGGDRAYGGIESIKIQSGHLAIGRYKPATENACMACYGFVETTDYLWDGKSLYAALVEVRKWEGRR